MGIFGFVSWVLVMVAAVTLIWPMNIPFAALAYRIRLGQQPFPLERSAFWWRTTFAALGLCGLSLVLLILAYVFVAGAKMPAGLVHLVLLMAYVTAGGLYFFWIFAMEDVFEGFSVFMLYILLLGPALLLIGRLAGFWSKVAQACPWALPSS